MTEDLLTILEKSPKRRPGTKKRWTGRELRQLRELATEGKTPDQIAEIMGVKPARIRDGLRRRIKRLRKRPTTVTIEQFVGNIANPRVRRKLRKELTSQAAVPEPAPSPLWLVVAIGIVLIAVFVLAQIEGRP